MAFKPNKEFKPHPIIKSGTLQTIASQYWWQLPDIPATQTHDVALEDKDILKVMEYRPDSWKPGKRIVLLVHGLVGCYQSNYMIRMTKKLNKMGINVFRMNHRGCGPGFGYAKKLYHSGRSEDTRAVIEFISKQHLNSPITQMGFSLGANITLKMAGEDSSNPSGNLDSVVAVSPPANLSSSSKRLINMGRMFNFYFVQKIKKDAALRFQKFPELKKVDIPRFVNLKDVDDIYLAPECGFKNADDYYAQCSADQFLGDIKIPSLILHAQDDPIIDGSYLRAIQNHEFIDTVETQSGGHVAFINNSNFQENFRWMDNVLLQWFNERLTH